MAALGHALTVPPQVTPEDRDLIIAELALRYRRAEGGLMRAVTAFGGAAEAGLRRLPPSLQDQLQRVVRAGLTQAYAAAARTDQAGAPSGAPWRDTALATLSGAGAGALGPAGFAEVPVAITLMLRAIRGVARDYGYDPDDPAVAQACLTVFAAGGPLERDDGVDSAFLSARIGLSGAALQATIARVSARLAGTLAQKLGAQTVPVLGALGGGAVNYAFIRYYIAMAHVRFGLQRLAEADDAADVAAAFRRALAPT